MSFEIEVLGYDELTEEEQEQFPFGEVDTYMRVNGEIYSDGMEPEDARFFRDLSWIHTEIDNAYAAGYADGLENAQEVPE